MQFSAIALSLFVAFTAAQNSTLPDLVSQLPSCAASCLDSSAKSAGCSSTDFVCLCSEDKRQSFITSVSSCIGFSAKCSQDDISKLSTLAPEICDAATSNPDPSAVASASNILTSAIGASSPTSSPDAGVRPEVGMGLVGIAAFAALAL